MRSSLLARRLLLLCTALPAPPCLLHKPTFPPPSFRTLMATATAPAPTATAPAAAPPGADARKVRGKARSKPASPPSGLARAEMHHIGGPD
jgi:hypothetical protein